MARSFTELQDDEEVKSDEVGVVLEDYAATGAAIISSVVIELIDQTLPNTYERAQMKVSAEKGMNDQLNRNFPKDAKSYQEVLDHIDIL